MIRLLSAGTAIALVLATGAFAQSTSSSDMSATSSMMAPSSDMGTSAMSSDMASSSVAASMTSSAMASDMTAASSTESSVMATATPFNILSGYTQATTDELASKIIGTPVYDGTGTDANNLGKINDFIVNKDGSIAAVILGVGGFLGLGEKQVAVDFHALQWQTAADNTQRLTLQTTKDQLTNAPDFKTVNANDASAAPPSGNIGVSASDAMGGSAMTSSSSAQ